MSMNHFPCMSCHGAINNEKAAIPLTKPHEKLKFKHMETIKNCYTCHDQKNRNLLVLANGKKVDFDNSYRICFQCHGEKKRDWEKGIHGKQIGSWNGDKFRFSCANCHEAHSPKFRLMKADPGPRHPHSKEMKKRMNHR